MPHSRRTKKKAKKRIIKLMNKNTGKTVTLKHTKRKKVKRLPRVFRIV